MKKYALNLVLLFLSLSTFAQHARKDLIGKWTETDYQKNKGSVQFLDTNKVVITFPNGEKPSFTYTIDLPKNPAKIDLSYSLENGQTGILYGYLFFVNDNTIKFQIFPNGNRPTTFTGNTALGPMLTLKRKKE